MTSFHAAVEKAWVINSWDRMKIPKPFSRVLVRVGKLIPVPPDTTDEELSGYSDELQAALDALSHGVTLDGVAYAGIEAKLDRTQGANVWLTIGLREGKNREIRRVLEHLGEEACKPRRRGTVDDAMIVRQRQR